MSLSDIVILFESILFSNRSASVVVMGQVEDHW